MTHRFEMLQRSGLAFVGAVTFTLMLVAASTPLVAIA